MNRTRRIDNFLVLLLALSCGSRKSNSLSSRDPSVRRIMLMATVYRKCDTNRISHKRPLIMGYSLTYYSALPQSDPPPFNCGSSATSHPTLAHSEANFAPVQGNNGQKLPSNSVLLLLLSSAGQKIKLLTVSLSTSHTVIHSTAHATTPQKRVTRRLHLFTGHKSTVNDL